MDARTRNLFLGFGAGLTLAALLPVVGPIVAEVTRPLSKALLKHTLLGVDRVVTYAARAAEAIEDLVVEVRAEVDAELPARRARGVTGDAKRKLEDETPPVEEPSRAKPQPAVS